MSRSLKRSALWASVEAQASELWPGQMVPKIIMCVLEACTKTEVVHLPIQERSVCLSP